MENLKISRGSFRTSKIRGRGGFSAWLLWFLGASTAIFAVSSPASYAYTNDSDTHSLIEAISKITAKYETLYPFTSTAHITSNIDDKTTITTYGSISHIQSTSPNINVDNFITVSYSEATTTFIANVSDIKNSLETSVGLSEVDVLNASEVFNTSAASPVAPEMSRDNLTIDITDLTQAATYTTPYQECEELLSSADAVPLANASWWKGGGGGEWIVYNRTSGGGRRLKVAMRVHPLATMAEDPQWTVLCVGVSHVAARSYEIPAVSISTPDPASTTASVVSNTSSDPTATAASAGPNTPAASTTTATSISTSDPAATTTPSEPNTTSDPFDTAVGTGPNTPAATTATPTTTAAVSISTPNPAAITAPVFSNTSSDPADTAASAGPNTPAATATTAASISTSEPAATTTFVNSNTTSDLANSAASARHNTPAATISISISTPEPAATTAPGDSTSDTTASNGPNNPAATTVTPTTAAALAASVDLNTRWDSPAGILRLRTRCWRLKRVFTECSPSFIPLQYLADLSLNHYSPLENEFGMNFTSNFKVINSSWIRSINITSFQGSIPAPWLYNMSMPLLENMYITGNDWQDYDINFINMSKLITLDLRNNNITFLPEEIFTNMTNLKAINLDQNSIANLPTSISRLKKLLIISIRNNTGNTTLSIPSDDFKRFPTSLKILQLSNTQLEMYLEDALLIPQLQYLNVSGCNIHFNKQNNTNNSSKIIVLDISRNNFNNISSAFFSGLSNLKVLIMNENNISTLPLFTIDNSLTHLYASHNKIGSLTYDTFMYLETLKVLDLSSCRIQMILGTIFRNSLNLVKVDLSHNLLQSIPPSLFITHFKLEEVDFSYNFLKSVDISDWSLRKLYFFHNNITYFSSVLSTIDYIDFSFNNISNIDLVASSVQKLNLSYNSLMFITYDMWRNISQSLEIDLGGNDFFCCRFKNKSYPNNRNVKIKNLGSPEPLQCYLETNSSSIQLISFLDSNEKCAPLNDADSMIIVIAIIVILMVAAAITTLILHMAQTRQRKFVLQHSANNGTSTLSL